MSTVNLARWSGLAAATALVSILLDRLGMPSHTVIGASAAGAGAPAVASGLGAAGMAAALAMGGWLLARTVRLPAPSLLGPMLLAAGAAIALPGLATHVPAPVLEGAFALVGLDVGLRFTA